MGRFIKNTVFKSASHALGVPTVTSSAIAPNAPQYGQTRFNSSSNRLEFYANLGVTGGSIGPGWYPLAHEGNVTLVKDSFTGDNVNTLFTPMKYSYAAGQEAQVLVHVGTVYQIPGTNYSFFGNTAINFSSAPSNLSAITIIHNLAGTTANI